MSGDVVDELRRRVATDASHEHRRPATGEALAHAESVLGFRLPTVLRRIHAEIADGGRLLRHHLFPATARDEATLVSCYAAVTDPGSGNGWPDRLLPFCELEGAWVCVDCRSDDGLVVVGYGDDDDPFVTSGRDLESWFRALLDGVDLAAETFEPAEVKSVLDPFTKRTVTRTVRGRARGRPWP